MPSVTRFDWRYAVRLTLGLTVIAALCFWIYLTHVSNVGQDHFMVAYYASVGVAVVLYMAVALMPKEPLASRAAPGRVVAIVPTYNEDPELLRNTVLSILNQQRARVDEVHVIDDGSTIPAEKLDDPRVVWHRHENAGKRGAQAYVLRRLRKEDWDFILTVDSDSVLHPKALWYMLRTMAERKVQACTGMVLTRNRTQNLVTRIADIDIFLSCTLSRGARSAIGSVNPTSGALAIYRPWVMFDNLEDYVSSGTDGDDRRLCEYALMRGDVISVERAYVDSAMPDTIRGTFRQRLRWGKSGWRFIPWELTNLPAKPMWLRLYEVCTGAMLPLLYVAIVVEFFRTDDIVLLLHGTLTAGLLWLAEVFFYAILRPFLTWKERVMALLLTPLFALVTLLIIQPAKYYSLFKLRDFGWVTRGNAHSQVASAKKGRHRAGTPVAPVIPEQRVDDTVPLRVASLPLLDPYAETTTELPLPTNLREAAE